MSNAVWGLDIGHSSIKAVRMERSGTVAQVTNFDVIEIEPSDDDSTRPQRVEAALGELLRRRPIGTEPVLLSVPGNQTFFRPFNLPTVDSRRLSEIVGFEARQLIPSPINEVLWDFKVLIPGPSGETRVGLVAIRRELVDQVLKQVRGLGLRVEAIQAAPLALYNLVHYEFGDSEAWLVLDAGARVTDFVIVDGDEFWFRPLPQSGNDLTRALEQKFRMTFDEAEQLKLKMGESKQSKKLFQVLEPILRNLLGDVQRTIGYYKGLRKEIEIDRVLGVGNTFRLPGIIDMITQGVGTEVTPLDRLARIRVGPAVDMAWWQEELPSMGVALGLGLQGLGFGRVDMEFLPESLIRERMLRKKRPLVAAGVAVAVAASAMSFLAAGHVRAALEGNLKQISEGLKDVETNARNDKAARAPIGDKEKYLARTSEGAARERGWVLECLDSINWFKTRAGRPAVGVDVVNGHSIYITALTVARDNPFEKMPNASADMREWYSRLGSGKPLVVVLEGELAGREGSSATGAPEVNLDVLDTLKGAIENASRIYPASSGEGEGRALEGAVTQTAAQKKAGVVAFTPAGGGETKEIKLSEIERLVWFRRVKLATGIDWGSRPLGNPEEISRRRSAGEEYPMRQYVRFTMAWVYDDGSTDLPTE